jgi:hypothetical protein
MLDGICWGYGFGLTSPGSMVFIRVPWEGFQSGHASHFSVPGTSEWGGGGREKRTFSSVFIPWNISTGDCCRLQLKNPWQKSKARARCWWLPPVILATQEAEIRRITVQGQPGQIVHKTLSRKNTKKGWWNGSRCRPWVQTPLLQRYILEAQKLGTKFCGTQHWSVKGAGGGGRGMSWRSLLKLF